MDEAKEYLFRAETALREIEAVNRSGRAADEPELVHLLASGGHRAVSHILEMLDPNYRIEGAGDE